MSGYKQVAVWLIALGPLFLVLAYSAWQAWFYRKIRKRNQKKMAEFNQLIKDSLRETR